MSNGIYGATIKKISKIIDTFEDAREELDDSGIALSVIPVLTADKDSIIGWILFDDDQHPYFVPEVVEESVDLLDTLDPDEIDWDAIYAEEIK